MDHLFELRWWFYLLILGSSLIYCGWGEDFEGSRLGFQVGTILPYILGLMILCSFRTWKVVFFGRSTKYVVA